MKWKTEIRHQFFLIFYLKKCGVHFLAAFFTFFKVLQFIRKIVTFLSTTRPFTFTFLSLKTKDIPRRPFSVYLERNALELSYWGILSSPCRNIDFPGLREMTYVPPNLYIILVKFSSKYILENWCFHSQPLQRELKKGKQLLCILWKKESESHSVMFDSLRPVNYTVHGIL